jgi:hypothetical protein
LVASVVPAPETDVNRRLSRPHLLPELRLRAGVLRRALARSRRRDTPLWSVAAEFDQAWKDRIRLMASFIDRPGAVADFGCGPMWLEEFLPRGNTYMPIDYIRRDARTIVVDLNKDQLPPLGASVAVMSGVLEYIEDLPAFVGQIEQQDFTRLIASYNSVDRVPRKLAREAVNWVSHLHLDELLILFCRSFDLVHVDRVSTNTILVLDRKH